MREHGEGVDIGSENSIVERQKAKSPLYYQRLVPTLNHKDVNTYVGCDAAIPEC